jgi:indolepyruvate ferredoxin oxidoreductase
VAEPGLPEVGASFDVFLAGIGGTGIVTVNAVLATAALSDGLTSVGLDQTGLSQKAGPVTSHLRLTPDGAAAPANRISAGSADTVLAFDLVVGSDPAHLALLSPRRTTVVASTSRTPTGDMVYDPGVRYPDEAPMLARLTQAARAAHTLDALTAAERLFGSTEVANLLLVGAAFQAGALPVSAASLERAIELNGVAVELNLAAFRWGRVSVADPEAFGAATTAAPRRAARRQTDGEEFLRGRALEGELRRLVAVRAAAMADHSGREAARRYVDLVERARQAERRAGERTEFAEAVARGAHRLAAYKDEYEVARLLTDPELERRALEQVPGATGLTYHLHPPALRSAGMGGKIGLGPAFRPVLAGLARARALRGTPLDPFGRTRIRRLERALVADYWWTVEELLAGLDADGYDRAVAIAESAELVRGYEDVKLAGVERYRARRAELGMPLSPAVLELLDPPASGLDGGRVEVGRARFRRGR